jgi:hypothetical protein
MQCTGFSSIMSTLHFQKTNCILYLVSLSKENEFYELSMVMRTGKTVCSHRDTNAKIST